MDFETFRNRSAELHKRANALQASIREEARSLSREAGLDPNLLGIHPHNAMCAFEAGQPWEGVDYSKVRKVLWLVNQKMWEPSRIVERISSRLYAQVTWK